jgi:hypothetical protein
LPIAYFRKPKPLRFTCPTKVQWSLNFRD